MIRINLGRDIGESQGKPKGLAALNINLPPEVKAKLDVITQDVRGLIIIGVCTALALLFPLFASQYKGFVISGHEEAMKHMNAQVGAIDQEINKFKPFQREMQSYEEQKKIVSSRLQVVNQLLSERGTPVSILDAIGQSLPARTWVQSMDLNLSGAESTFALAGSAYSNEEISDFIERLSESIYFTDVVLNDVNSKADGKVELKSFSLSAKPKLTRLSEGVRDLSAKK